MSSYACRDASRAAKSVAVVSLSELLKKKKKSTLPLPLAGKSPGCVFACLEPETQRWGVGRRMKRKEALSKSSACRAITISHQLHPCPPPLHRHRIPTATSKCGYGKVSFCHRSVPRPWVLCALLTFGLQHSERTEPITSERTTSQESHKKPVVCLADCQLITF